MPQLIWLYLTALLYYRTSVSCVALAEALETVSHDRLTRLLQADWPGRTLLERAFHTLFVWERGYLILDDTVIPRPFATAIEGLAWVFSSQERKPVYGLSLVLLVWTNGTLRIPLSMRLWCRGGPSKYELALEVLSYARNRLRCRPTDVLFQAWYPSKRLLLCCLVAFCVLERESHDRGVSIYQLQRHLSFKGRAIVLPALERLRTAA
jgi:DDE superfamily endonuclease